MNYHHHLRIAVVGIVLLVVASLSPPGVAALGGRPSERYSEVIDKPIEVAATDAMAPHDAPRANQETAKRSRVDKTPDHDQHAHEPGLGAYGASGPISRSDLPAGLADTVSEDALRLAASPELAGARQGWSSPMDFVGQVDYQVDFRASYDFLDAGPEHLAAVLSGQPSTEQGTEEMALYLTQAEADEFERRDALGERIDAVKAAIGRRSGRWAATPNLVDVRQDQQNGGRLVLAVLDRKQVDLGRLPWGVSAQDVAILEVPYSAEQYSQFKKTIARELREQGVSYSVGQRMNSEGLMLEVRVLDTSSMANVSVPRDVYRVISGQNQAPINRPNADHDWADLQAGLGLVFQSGGGACTWGLNGHTNNYNYVITAGHCLDDEFRDTSGWVGSGVELWTGNPLDFTRHKHLTPGNTFVMARLREIENNDGFDVARMTSGEADTNCYHGTTSNWSSDCPWQIENRTLHNYWEPDSDRTCASLGRSNRYRCGLILDENVEIGYGEEFNNFFTDRAVTVDFPGRPGDSGSGVKWNDTFDGLVICCDESDIVHIMTAWDVKRGLNHNLSTWRFDFNCARGFAQNDPEDWGSCPAIDR